MKKLLLLLLAVCTQTVLCHNPNKEPLISNPFVRSLPTTLGEFCDACGCSANGGSMGFSSMLHEQFVGVRYFYQSYQSRDGVFSNSPWIAENFNTAQVWSRIPISKKWEVMALVPYQFHNRQKPDESQSVAGLGDITMMLFYNIFQTMPDSTTVFRHKILVGAGIKAPTGQYDSRNNGSINPSFQLGTGSWDYSVAAEYIISKNKWGLNTTLNYILKTENDQQYQFGDQLNYGSTFFYNTSFKKVRVVPQIGLAGETYEANEDHGEAVPLTKGDIFFGKMGVEAGYMKFSIGMNAMIPVTQNLTGGRVEAKYRIGIHVNYSL